tara:strand:- start:1343 stop:2419 length:1077 start_codon:yes stop_codon:yes gene_type:complete
MRTENMDISAQFINQSFVRKLDEGRVKEAQDEGSRFIRSKLRQESFAREIIAPVEIGADEIDRDENTDQPKKIIEKEPDSVATFVTFKGSGQRTFFRGPRYSVFFGKIETQHFSKSKFELLTYQNDIRKILTDNSVKDMADEEDRKFLETVDAAMGQVGKRVYLDDAANAAFHDANAGNFGDEDVAGAVKFDAGGEGTGGSRQFSFANLSAGNRFHCNGSPLTKELIAQIFQSMTMKKLPVGKLLMTKSTFMEAIKFDQSEVGDTTVARHYDKGLEGEDKLFGIPVVTTIKNDIINDDQIYLFAPQNYLGNFFLLQDATLFIKQEADMIEFWSYSAPGIGIGNALGAARIEGFSAIGG